ncbi:MAG: transcriptional repressor [Deinococcus sp.]|nr:transcriptional repressor [Deinococcus sp.]
MAEKAPKEMRLTKQRQAVLAALRSTDTHPDAAWVYQEVRQSLPGISLGTVYRSLAALVDQGLIQELPQEGKVLYDANITPHQHAVCTSCSRVFDLVLPPLDQLYREARRRSGFHSISAYRLDFYGLCQRCAAA